MSYSIYVDGTAPNNQHGCKRCGIGRLVVMDEDNEIVHEESITHRDIASTYL